MEMSVVNSSRIRILTCAVLVLAMIVGLASTAMAAPGLDWHSDNVFFDTQGRLVIEGYFYNSGSTAITGVNWFDVKVYLRQQSTNWWQHTAATFYDVNLQLQPGETTRWTFRITNVEYAYFDFWDVKWKANYNYLR
jgi:hypothetical protein